MPQTCMGGLMPIALCRQAHGSRVFIFLDRLSLCDMILILCAEMRCRIAACGKEAASAAVALEISSIDKAIEKATSVLTARVQQS